MDKKVHFKYLGKIKQLPNQYVHDFMKVWKHTTNKITMPEQDLNDTIFNALLPLYKILVISNHDMKLGEMMDVLFKKKILLKSCMLCVTILQHTKRKFKLFKMVRKLK